MAWSDHRFSLEWGTCYSNGTGGVTHDLKRMEEWWSRGAQGGNLACSVKIGSLYERGYGVRQDRKQAFEHYLKAAQGGHLEGMLRTAQCYQFAVDYFFIFFFFFFSAIMMERRLV